MTTARTLPRRPAAGRDRPAPAAAAQVSVLLPLPLDRPFDYRVPDGPPLPPGSFVEVPFGSREVVGVVWDTPAAQRVPAARLKDVQRRLDAPPMPPGLRRLIEHVAATTLAPLGAALRLALSVPAALEPPAPRTGYVPAAEAEGAPRLTAARRKVLAALNGEVPLAAAELTRAAGVTAAVVHGMVKAGLLHAVALPEAPDAPGPDPDAQGPALSPAQEQAAQALREQAAVQAHGVTLLEGVPGAGKTEVYFEAVAATLRRGRQVLVLLPEIALSAQWLERFARRFGAPPAAWHSELTAAQRRRTWRRIAEGRERVVVGARSALFLPLAELGLIVVDEEHDGSFKQDDGVAYHARDMALARARFEDCACVLVSATPSLESALAAGAVEDPDAPRPPTYDHLRLPARHQGVPMPRLELIDLKLDPPPRGGWLAPRLRRELAATLEAGEQALLFLNRRGYAPLTLCRACGHRVQCPNCTAWLVEHRLRRRLQCHHCGYGVAEPEHCPACGTLDALVACGPGVERVAEEVAELFPAARLEVMTSDSIRSAKDAAELVGAMHDHRVDVLIGTQIIAKGHHFPDLTLVGVVDGDLGLGGGDLRAAERSFQLLYQVAGRAGRAGRPGRAVIQTHLPEHPVMRALAEGDEARFYAAEALQRRAGGMPPFGRLAALVVSGRDLDAVRRAARRLAETAPEEPGLIVLGPAPAPLALLRGRHRQRLLVKARPDLDLPVRLRRWLRAVKLAGGVRLQVDVDPYSFL